MNEWGVKKPLPAARPLGDFASERIGDELILFDGSTMQYHTLNGVAEQIWRFCDGTSSIETIATATGLPIETVETTIGELGEASLLTTSADRWSVPMTRRRAAKLIAAGAVGAVGVPVVLSITAPSHQAAATDPVDCKAVGSYGYCASDADCSQQWCSETSIYCGTDGCCWCRPAAPRPVDIVESTDDGHFESLFENDPYANVDENGDVDLEAIQRQKAVTEPPTASQPETPAQDALPEASINDIVSADGVVDSETVEAASGDTGN